MHAAQPSGLAEAIGPQNDQPRMYVEWVKETALTVSPDRVTFLVKINNKLPRVFRGTGTVVQFNVGGKLQAVSQEGYEPLTGIIVPPRTEQQIQITGPPVSSLSASNPLIGLFFYDVVTNISDAGVVTEKQNYEWYFTYTLESKTETSPTSQGAGTCRSLSTRSGRRSRLRDKRRGFYLAVMASGAATALASLSRFSPVLNESLPAMEETHVR